jgi:hypothetical protein
MVKPSRIVAKPRIDLNYFTRCFMLSQIVTAEYSLVRAAEEVLA